MAPIYRTTNSTPPTWIERQSVMDVLSQVLHTIENPQTDDQERISFTRHKLSFLLDWLRAKNGH
jgi:hypothetical protein